MVALPLLLVFLFRRGHSPVALAGIGLAALIALAVFGRMAQTHYLDERYSSAAPDYPKTEQPAVELNQGLGAAYDWAREARGLHIALSGTMGALFQYGLWGGDSSNSVTYIGKKGPRGSFNEIPECPEWIAALNDGDYDYVITTPTYHQDDPAADTAPRAARLDLPRRQRPARRRRRPGRHLEGDGPARSAGLRRRARSATASACYQIGVAYPLDNALFQWEEGARRLRELEADPRRARTAVRAVDAIRDELRRRIGPTFSAQELAELYGRGTDWCLEAARAAAPMAAVDLDPQAIVDGAFFQYLRGAKRLLGRESGGGRTLRLLPQPGERGTGLTWLRRVAPKLTFDTRSCACRSISATGPAAEHRQSSTRSSTIRSGSIVTFRALWPSQCSA